VVIQGEASSSNDENKEASKENLCNTHKYNISVPLHNAAKKHKTLFEIRTYKKLIRILFIFLSSEADT